MAYQLAAEAQAKVLAVDPTDGPGTMLLALYRLKSGDTEGIGALVKKAESLGAADIYSQLAKVRILELLGRREEALSTVAAAMRRGVTIFQIRATHDLDSLRADPRFPDSESSKLLPEASNLEEGRL